MPRATIPQYALRKLNDVNRLFVDSLAEKAGAGDVDAHRELQSLAALAKRNKPRGATAAPPKPVQEPIEQAETSIEQAAPQGLHAVADTPKAPRAPRKRTKAA